MKVAFSFLLAIAITGAVKAQSGISRQTICLITAIPVLIESDPIVCLFDQKGNFTMAPGHIRIKSIGREQPFEFDHLIQMGKALPIDQKRKIHFTIRIDNKLIGKSDLNGRFTKDYLIDMVLKKDQSLSLVWKDELDHTIQTITFRCVPIVPQIIGIKESSVIDSIDQPHKARQIKRQKDLPQGYNEITKDLIELKADKHLEIKLDSYSLLPDSSLLYRVTNKKEHIPGKWMPTGHILTLPDLIAGDDYALELKYIGQAEIKTYQIAKAPFWHQRIWIRLIGIGLLIIITVLLTRWYFQRRIRLIADQRQRLEEQLTTIQSQLNPHFIFNALSSIEGLVTTGDNKLANEYLNTFSSIMRETLKNADKILISLEEEIQLLEKYISIEQLRFGIKCKLEIDEQIQIAEIQVPPMLVQPLVENAIKHGADGLITITITQQGSDMLIRVYNHKSVKKSNVKTAGGYGWTYTKQRLNHFSKLNQETPIKFVFEEKETLAEASLIFKKWFN